MKFSHLLAYISTLITITLVIGVYSHHVQAAGTCGVPRLDCDSGHIEPANQIYISESQVSGLTSDLASMTNYTLSTDTRLSNARTPTGNMYAGSNIYFTTGTSTSTTTVAALANSPIINSSGGGGTSWVVAYEQDFTTVTSSSTKTKTATYTTTSSSTNTVTMTSVGGTGNQVIAGITTHTGFTMSEDPAWLSDLGLALQGDSGGWLYDCTWQAPTIWWRLSDISPYISDVFTNDIAVEFMLRRDQDPTSGDSRLAAGIQIPYADDTTVHEQSTGPNTTMRFDVNHYYSGGNTQMDGEWVSCDYNGSGTEQRMYGQSGAYFRNIFAFEIFGALLKAFSVSNAAAPNNWMPWANNTAQGIGLARLLGTVDSNSNGHINGYNWARVAGEGYQSWGLFFSYSPSGVGEGPKTMWLQKMRVRYKQNGL